MDALFIVPTLVSPQVNEKMIPALAKMIERNIILNNSALFKKAAIEKNSRYTSWSKVSENGIPVTILSDGIISESNTLLNTIQPTKQSLYEATKAVEYFLDDSDTNSWSGDLKDLNKRIKNLEDAANQATNQAEKQGYLKDADRLKQEALTLINNAVKVQNDFEDKIRKQQEELKGKQLTSEEKRKIQMDIESLKNIKLTFKKNEYELNKAKEYDKKARSAELKTYRDSSYVKPEDVEMPSGIQFFRQISLEPTILSIPISTGTVVGEGMVIKVGVKCIPYILDDVTSIVDLLTEAKNMGVIERLFKNAIRKVNTKIWFTKRRSINKGKYLDPNEATEAIKYTPNTKELVRYINLAKSFNSMDSASWSTMVVMSSNDIESNEDLLDIVSNYRKLTKYVFGDIIITNETKESAYFCTPRFGSCQEIPYSYLSKVLNLSDVIDYSDASRASAWRKETNTRDSNVKKAISESAYKEIQDKLTKLLRSK